MLAALPEDWSLDLIHSPITLTPGEANTFLAFISNLTHMHIHINQIVTKLLGAEYSAQFRELP